MCASVCPWFQATGILNAIGNKGGLMVRVVLEGGESIAFVAVHLAAHEGAKHVQAGPGRYGLPCRHISLPLLLC
jgi:hypothetical protein